MSALLKKPVAAKSIISFKKLMRSHSKAIDILKVKEEFDEFDTRIERGDVMEAFAGRIRKKVKSKL